MLLSAQPDIRVVGEAENGDQALQQVRDKKPAILLLDISMPGSSGLEVIKEVLKISRETRVLILTMLTEPVYLNSVLAAGAAGFVLKRSLDSDLLSAIRAVQQGDQFIDASMTKFIIEKALVQQTGKQSPKTACGLLSRRELQVLKLAAHGFTNRQIASQLFLSVKSVETYRARVLKKLNIHDRAHLVRFAVEAGLLSAQNSVPTG
jgi:DNA-binding NarL/FixJ family response regulator